MRPRLPWPATSGSTAPRQSRCKPELPYQKTWLIALSLPGPFGRQRPRLASRVRAADRQAVHPQCRLTDADRYGLPVLAASADPVVETKIVADHRDLGQRVWAVADQGRALDRGADFTVLDQIGLRGGKHELARGDVDLPAAEIDRVQTLLHRGDDLLGILSPGQHVGVRHPRHWRMGKTLAPAVSGRSGAEQPRVHAVLHVAFEDPVLDQHRVIRRR